MSEFDYLRSLLSNIPEDSQHVSFLGFTILTLASIIFSIACANLYLAFFDQNSTGSKVYRAFPLIGPAITCIFITVQFSLPLSLGLLGALSIVRFRTPIKEPEEIGFILLLIACSLSIATFNIIFTLILIVLAFLTLLTLKYSNLLQSSHNRTGVLHLEIPIESDSQHDIVDRLSTHFQDIKLPAFVTSIHHDDDHIHLTYKTKKSIRSITEIIKAIKYKFPKANIAFHDL